MGEKLAYPSHIAATLSGATVRQLAYWRSSANGMPLLAPELATGGRTFYSFRDLIALRTFVFIREEAPLQRLRKAVNTLRDLGNTEHLSQYRLVVVGDSVVWESPDDEQAVIDLVRQPGAARMREVLLGEIMRPFKNRRGVTVVDFRRPKPNIEVDPAVQGGYPVIRGTRVQFDLIASLVADGVRPEEIQLIYPSVSPEAAQDAADFAEVVQAFKTGQLSAVS